MWVCRAHRHTHWLRAYSGLGTETGDKRKEDRGDLFSRRVYSFMVEAGPM
jgi:hypothetical protein